MDYCQYLEQEASRMANHTGKVFFKKGVSGNPGCRPKLPAEIRQNRNQRTCMALFGLLASMVCPARREAVAALTAKDHRRRATEGSVNDI